MRSTWIIVVTAAATVLVAIGVIVVFGSRTSAPGSLSRSETDQAGATRVTFVTDWRAQAEHGGFYQALADGLYEEAGLDVTILQGGPSINVPQLLAAGTVDFGLGSNSFIPLNMAAAGIEAKAVMASFQKDPQVLIAHPRDDIASIADMKGKPIMISDATIGAFWVWLEAKFGFTDDQIRKYTFNLAPFLSDPGAIQQGYISSEPYLIEQTLGYPPEVYLLSDEGYPGYAAFILARNDLIEGRPQVVQAFVDASIEGWRRYLNGDPSPANALIRAENEEMTEAMLAQAIGKLKAHGIVEPPQGAGQDIGTMTDQRWEEFFSIMAENGVYDTDLDWRSAFTLAFLNAKEEPATLAQ